MARIQLWVDVEALKAAIINAPIYAKDAFAIAEAAGIRTPSGEPLTRLDQHRELQSSQKGS
jgi:hypothetical protein